MSDTYPAGWAHTQVQNVITKYFCGHSPTCEERPIANIEEWGILKTTAITWDGWNENAHKVPPKKYWGKENIEVKEGDILVTKAGPRHRVGVVAHVQSTRPHLMVSGKMIGIRPQQEMVLPRILAAALSTREPQVFLDHRSTGMAESQVNFNNDVLLTASIVLPTMPEQRAISATLDTVDEVIWQTEVMIAKLRQMKAGMLHDLLTCGLDENGELRDPICHPEQFKDSPVGWIPKAWTVTILSRACQKITDGVHFAVRKTESGFPFLFVSCIRNGDILFEKSSYIDQKTYKTISKGCEPRPGVVLYTVVGSYGQAAEVTTDSEFGFERNIAYIMPNQEQLYSSYLVAWLNSATGRNTADKYALGNAQKLISLGQLGSFEIPLPQIEEQHRIAEQQKHVSAAIGSYKDTLRKCRQLKQGLMQDLLTGRVRVPETIIQNYQVESEVV